MLKCSIEVVSMDEFWKEIWSNLGRMQMIWGVWGRGSELIESVISVLYGVVCSLGFLFELLIQGSSFPCKTLFYLVF